MKWSLIWAIPHPLDLEGGFEAWTHRTRVVDEETVTVDFLREPSGLEVVLKRYRFPRWRHRWRGAARHTLFGMPKALREFHALRRMLAMNVPVVEPLGAGVLRGASGFVHDSWLITLRAPGRDLEGLLAVGTAPSAETWHRLGASVRAMHAGGVWYRGLAPRNVLVAGSEEDPLVRWLDPARAVFVGDALPDPIVACDLLRLWAPLRTVVDEEARRAFDAGYGEEGAADAQRLWERAPSWTRRRLQAIVAREAERLEARRGEWD